MNHRCKRRVQLHDHVPALKTNRIRHLITVNFDTDQRAVHEAHFDFFAAKLPGQLLLGLGLGALLHELDDFFHFGQVKRLVWLLARHADSGGCAFDEFAGDADNGGAHAHAGLVFGLTQSFVTVFDHTADVGDCAGLHVAERLVGAADSYDFHTFWQYAANQRLDKLGTDVERYYILVLRCFFTTGCNFFGRLSASAGCLGGNPRRNNMAEVLHLIKHNRIQLYHAAPQIGVSTGKIFAVWTKHSQTTNISL